MARYMWAMMIVMFILAFLAALITPNPQVFGHQALAVARSFGLDLPVNHHTGPNAPMPTLHWLTKDEDIQAARKVPYRLLEEVPDLSYGDLNSGNMLIQGENLDALKALLPYYAGKVKCIYAVT